MIELQGVSKSYARSRVKALEGLSLSVRGGELFGFLGPNGAGKTTTIKILLGLLRPDAGAVTVDGLDVLRSPLEVKRRTGYVPDEPLLYENMSGQRFLSFIADVFGMPDEARGAAVGLAEEFEVRELLGERIDSYSHGTRQKISIISALLHEPEVFVLDEPIVGLDPRAAFVLKEKMRERCRAGKTVFFSTHVMEVAERLCDRVGIIDKGRMLAVGPLEELRARAGGKDATLEQVFLRLTDDDAGPA